MIDLAEAVPLEIIFKSVLRSLSERRTWFLTFGKAYPSPLGRVYHGNQFLCSFSINKLLVCPVPANIGQNGCFPKSAFKIDLEAKTCQCPVGKLAVEIIYDKKTNRLKVFVFSQEECQNWPLLSQCTKSKKGRRTVTVNQYERYLQEARVFQQTEEFKQEYPERCKIENKQAEMVHHGLHQAHSIFKIHHRQ
ncbi:transposase [Pelotomaculum schinkii]|uniref:transposase n=1 Tax=Pelotomaculum schinkii TaxID=78350 RepID=UPI00249F3D33|nr:transposase [Pelotomaculum schinkii]